MAKNILITGASGLIGTRLTEVLLQRGHQVSHVGRSRISNYGIPFFTWDIELGIIDPKALASADVIIHLAGANVADKRWTKKIKNEVLQSRIKTTDLLIKALTNRENYPLKTFVSASAIGYYGFGNDSTVFTEESAPGTDFLAQVVQEWEAEVDKISRPGLRIVKLRTGVVLSEKGGALKSITRPVKLGVGAALGTGQQYVSWIHIEDLCAIFSKAVEDETLIGVYNAVSNAPATNLEMTQTIAKVLRRPLWLPSIPGFVLKILIGEMASMVLEGSKVSAVRIMNTGFQFQFPTLEGALRNLYKV